MLDWRLYRLALVPVALALLVAAFSLQARPRPIDTTLPPDAFDGARAAAQLDSMVSRYPVRRPGDVGDTGLAGYVARSLARPALSGEAPFKVTVHRFDAETIDGRQSLLNVVATRAGAPGPGLLILAHRDAASRVDPAQLSGTAALLELGRVFADGRLRRTTTLASTSGGSGGNAGAVRLAQEVSGPFAAVIVLGDIAGSVQRDPVVVSTSNGRGFAPLQLQRTVAAAVRQEVGVSTRPLAVTDQFARLAFPFAPGEQASLLKAGVPAVLLQASGERGPKAGEQLAPGRLGTYGRAALRAITALDNGPDPRAGIREDVVTLQKVVPGWAVRLLVAALLIAPLLVGIDGCARIRRRGGDLLVWVGWLFATALPFALAAVAILVLGLTGAIHVRPEAPVLPGIVPTQVAVMIVVGLVFALGWLARWALVRTLGLGGSSPAAPGAGGVVILVLAVLAWAVWFANPFAAALLVLPTHLWLAVLAPGLRVRRPLAVGLIIIGMLPIVLVLISLSSQLGYEVPAFAWALVLGVAGGQPGVVACLTWSLVFGLAVAAGIIAVRGQPAADLPADVTVRGPLGYAGPGSLGGTTSGFRRS